jgi:gas vesicle protein
MEHRDRPKARSGLAFALGAVAGSVVALLYAPARGTQTRQKIRETARNTFHKGGEVVEEAKQSIEKGASHVAETASRNKEALRDAVSEAKTAYRREMANTREES